MIKFKLSKGKQVTSAEHNESKKLQRTYTELLNVAAANNPLKYKLDQFPISSAIVVFESPKARDVCILAHQKFAPDLTLDCRSQPPLEFLFRGHYHLTV